MRVKVSGFLTSWDFSEKNEHYHDTSAHPGEIIHGIRHHRIIHELLHTLGITEEEMNFYTIPACIATYEVANPFIETLLNQRQDINNAFSKSMLDFSCNFPKLEKQLLQMGDSLCSYGFPEKIDSPMYTTTFLPSKFYPNPDVTGYEVLLM